MICHIASINVKDFFVSYNKADRAWAEWIAWELEAASYTTVVQAWDFRAGSDFVLEMDKALKETARTLAVLSKEYLAAAFTQPEWAAALATDPTGEQCVLVPVRVRECTPEGLLRSRVYIDLLGLDEGSARKALIAGIERGRIKPSAQPPFPGDQRTKPARQPLFPGPLPPRPDWRRMFAVIALALAIAALLVWKFRREPEPVPVPPKAGYVLLGPGEFAMGCDPEEPPCYPDETPHRVRLPNKFYIKRTEVAVGEYLEYAKRGAAPLPPANDPELPITGITWDQAKAYCQSTGGRLPTEAEWEYAARGGTETRFYGRLDDIAWYSGNTPLNSPQKVGQKLPNAFKLYDMLGNVAEWVNDWYDSSYYAGSPHTNPKGPVSGTGRVIRGGSSLDGPDLLRVSRRDSRPPSATASNVGFRCAQDPR